ncbi:MAG: T9SS type A sorting domain-containing protein [bacterium]|nr:T9SS type A sorting domain-containing protein [bacterium]
MKRFVSIFLLLFVLPILPDSTAFSTPYWDEQDYHRYQENSICQFQTPHPSNIGAGVDQYSLLFEYVQICNFLRNMQELNFSSPNYGGMHEGETPELWAILQTDNTQEAIRVWSTYGQLSGDLTTYAENIQAAWVYTLNYPAYSEEGTDSDYYRVHNCGWALAAESTYRQVYGDDSYLTYADSCAAYIMTHRLPYTGTSDYYIRLHPLVEGWAAGTLYDYGVEQAHPDAVTQALIVGSDVKTWIQANPNRLNNNEVWAMSGGTAMWGVCRSVFTADPASGQSWLPQYLPYMDTYAGLGTWNNSWNVWYAHAYHASAAVLNNPIYTGLAYALVDTLLDADTDNDGGIMATSMDPPTMDQSWVSCYLDYMGLSYLINALPGIDAVAFGFLQPDTTQPIAQGDPVLITVLVANGGLQPFGNVNVEISGAYSAASSTYLDFADVDTLYFEPWIPLQHGLNTLTLRVTPGGANAANDTLTLPVNVLGWGEITGRVYSGMPLSAQLSFYLEGLSPETPYLTVTNDPFTGDYHADLVEGEYRVVVDPQIPYTDREITDVIVHIDQSTEVNFELNPAPIILVDDDGGAQYETYFAASLANAGYDAYRWSIAQSGAPESELSLFDAVIWFTGNELDSALTPGEREILTSYLDAGGKLLLTGQNIADGISSLPFLSEYLGASFAGPQSGQYQVNGVEGDPVTSGMNMFLAGYGGAGNQNSTDMIAAAGSGTIAMRYVGSAQAGAGVRVEGTYKSVFLSFGLEGVSGIGASTSREEFFSSIMDWFEVPTGITLPQSNFNRPAFNTIGLSPNPFNPDVQISFSLPQKEQTILTIFNLRGQLVDKRELGLLDPGVQFINYRFTPERSSGVYIFNLHTSNSEISKKGILLK